MRLLITILAGSLAFFSSACLKQECRTCEAFTFDAESFNPDYAERDIVLRNVATDEEITFAFVQLLNSNEQETCADVSSPADIACSSAGNAAYRSQELMIDMNLGFQATDENTDVVMAYSFKGTAATQFTPTHALRNAPDIQLVADRVVQLDSLPLGDTLLLDVIDIRQPVEAFATVGAVLPEAGRFTNVYFREGGGLLGLRDVNDRVYIRQD